MTNVFYLRYSVTQWMLHENRISQFNVLIFLIFMHISYSRTPFFPTAFDMWLKGLLWLNPNKLWFLWGFSPPCLLPAWHVAANTLTLTCEWCLLIIYCSQQTQQKTTRRCGFKVFTSVMSVRLLEGNGTAGYHIGYIYLYICFNKCALIFVLMQHSSKVRRGWQKYIFLKVQ